MIWKRTKHHTPCTVTGVILIRVLGYLLDMEANVGLLAEFTLYPDGRASISDKLTKDNFACEDVTAGGNQTWYATAPSSGNMLAVFGCRWPGGLTCWMGV